MTNAADERPKGRPRRWRRVARVALALVAVAVLLLALALAATQTATFRSYLRARVVEQVNAALAGRVSVASIDGTLLGSLILNDLVLTLDDTEVIAAQRVVAEYSLLPLLVTQTLVIERARASGVRVHLVQDARGWNISRVVPPSEEEEPEPGAMPIDVRVEELILEDGQLDVVLPDQSFALREVGLRGSLEVDDAGQRAVVEALTLALPARDLRLTELRADFAYRDDGTLAVEDVVIKTAASSVSGGAVVGGEGDYDVNLAIELAAAELQRLIGSAVLATDVTAKLVASGPAEDVRVEGQVATIDAGKIDVGGRVDLRGERLGYDLRVALDRLNVAGLLGPEHPVTDLRGAVSAKGAGVTLADAAASLAAELSDSAVADTRIVRLAADGTVENGQVAARADLATALGNGRVNGTLDVRREAYDVTVDATGLDPTAFLGRPDLRARINGRAVVRGTGFDPATARAQAEVRLSESTIDRLRVQALDARLTLAGGRLAVEQMALDSNAARANASGAIGVAALTGGQDARATSGNVQYRVEVSDLAVLAAIAGQPDVAGRVAITGTASGSLRALDVDAEISGAGLAAGGVKVDALAADVQGRAIGTARATATVGARATQMRAGGRSFMLVRPRVAWQAGPEADTVRIDLDAREDAQHEHALRATVAIAANEIRAVVETLRLALGDDVWTNSDPARLAWRDGRAEIDGLALRSNGGTVAISGTGGTRGAQDLQVSVTGVALAPLLEPDVADVSGTLSGAAQLRGSAGAPRLDVEVSIDQPVIEGMAYETVRAELRVGDGSARANARIVQSEQNELTFTGQLDVRLALSPFAFALGDRLTGQLRAADIELAIFDPLLPQVSGLKGRLDADVTLSGAPRAPELRGPITLRDGGARVTATGITYDPIELRMSLGGRSIEVENLRLVAGDGSMTGNGNARWTAEGPEGAVTLVLQKFPVFRNQYGEGVTNGRIAISGSTAAPLVEGEIETERLVFRIPEKLPGQVRPPDPTITVVRPTAAAAAHTRDDDGADEETPTESETDTTPTDGEEAAAPGVYDRATMRIAIRVPRNAWLRRSDTEIELRGALTVTKDPGDPLAVAGEINAVRGWYSFQGRKFTVEEGTVTLTGQDLNPLLDVVALYSTGDYTVRIRVGGTVRTPTLKLESEPPLPQADILSVLVFGRPADQLSQGESQGLRERALAVAGGYAASEFRRSVADALGVDTLEIEPGSEGLANTSASVGKYITEDIFVSLSHKFGAENVQQLRVQYFLTPRWTIETTADTAGQSGIDVFWRRRY